MPMGGLGPTVIAVMWCQTWAAAIFVGARMYTRHYVVKANGYDDWLMVASLVLFFLYTIFCTAAANFGLGSHMGDLTNAQFVNSNKMEVAGQTCNILAIATSKSAVAVFLLRLVVVAWHKWFLWFCIFSTVVVCVSCAILDFFQSTPFPAIFDATLPHKVNFNFTANAIFSGAYTAMIDIVLALFPWYFLAKVQIRKKERLTISFGLTLGVFAGICGIIRAVELGNLGGADYSYETVPLILWGSSELLVAIACASIPCLRPLYKRLRGQSKSSDDQSGPMRTGTKSHGYALSSIRRDEFSAAERPVEYSAEVGSEPERMAAGMDNGSDESILRDAWRYGIGKTTVVNVTYDENHGISKHSDSFERHI